MSDVSVCIYETLANRRAAGWLADGPINAVDVAAYRLLWLPYDLLYTQDPVWLWPVAALSAFLVVLSRQDGGVTYMWRARPAFIVGWVFAAGLFYWYQYYDAIALPLAVVCAWFGTTAVLILAQRRVILERRLKGPPLPPGRAWLKLKTATRLVNLTDLYEAAAEFFNLHRRGRQHDRTAPGQLRQDAANELRVLITAERDLLAWPPGTTGPAGPRLPSDITPFDLAMCVGPKRTPDRMALYTAQLAALLSLPMAGYFFWHDYLQPFWINASVRPESGGVDILFVLLNEIIFWILPAFLFGLLWQQLPGRRGPVKALPLVLGYAIGVAIHTTAMVGINHVMIWTDLLRCGLLLGLLTFIGAWVDLRTIRRIMPGWSRPWHFLMDAYRLDSFPTQLTFLLAQVAAVLAIIQYLRSGGADGPPQYPSIDPFQIGRQPGG